MDKSKSLKLNEIGPETSISAVSKKDRLFSLTEISHKELDNLPEKSTVVVEVVGRLSFAEEAQKRFSVLEKQNDVLMILVAKLTAPKVLLQLVQNVILYEKKFIVHTFPEFAKKQVTLRNLDDFIKKRPNLVARKESFIKLNFYLTLKTLVDSLEYYSAKEERHLRAHPEFQLNEFTEELELFELLNLDSHPREHKEMGIIKNVLPLYKKFMQEVKLEFSEDFQE